jgi:hypothetical protein
MPIFSQIEEILIFSTTQQFNQLTILERKIFMKKAVLIMTLVFLLSFTVIYKAPVDKKMPGVCPDLTNDSVMMASKNKER